MFEIILISFLSLGPFSQEEYLAEPSLRITMDFRVMTADYPDLFGVIELSTILDEQAAPEVSVGANTKFIEKSEENWSWPKQKLKLVGTVMREQ